MASNNALGQFDILGLSPCQCGPDITRVFFAYLRANYGYLNELPSDVRGLVDGIAKMSEIGGDIDFWYRGIKHGCKTGKKCKNTVGFNGRCVRDTVPNNILFGFVAAAMEIPYDGAVIGANLNNIGKGQGSEGNEQQGAYDIGYDLWSAFEQEARHSDILSAVVRASDFYPWWEIGLKTNSLDAVSESFADCKPCRKSLKPSQIGRVGIGFYMGWSPK